MAAALARSTARHRPAVDAVLRSTGAGLLHPAPAARLSPRRQLCDAAVAKIARTELNRVEAAAAARYEATGKTMDELTEKVSALSLKLSKKQTDASLDLARTSTKVCALVLSSAVALGGFSYIVISPGGSSPPPAASKEIDKGMEEIKARLTGKISEWYEEEEAKSSVKVVVDNPKPPLSKTPGSKPGSKTPGSTPGSKPPGSTPTGSTPVSTPPGSTPVSTPTGSTPVSTPPGSPPVSTPPGSPPVSTPPGNKP